MNVWTTEKVLTLAPDSSSAKAGQSLAHVNRWSNLGKSEQALWGECKGSAKEPYRTRVDINEPAFKCSCPSRKFPCKHALGLLLIYASQPKAISTNESPGWVSEWLEHRTKRKDQQEERAKAKQETEIADPEAQAKRAVQRETRVKAGIQEFRLWLSDLVRQGLAWAQTQGNSYWENAAARMVDAQASGLARYIRSMAAAASSGDGWQERLLAEIARAYLLVRAFDKLDSLPAETQTDVRSLLGWTIDKDNLFKLPRVRDTWLVLAQRVEEDQRIQVQRTWMWGKQCNKPALILDFAVGNQMLDASLVVGSMVDAELIYYPSALPLRALVAERFSKLDAIETTCLKNNIDNALKDYANALAIFPWLDKWPMVVSEVHIEMQEHSETASFIKWYLLDNSGTQIALSLRFVQAWHTLAIAGNRSFTAFGEWNGFDFEPQCIIADNDFYRVENVPVTGMVQVA